MLIGGEQLQSIWYEADNDKVCIIDQTRLPRHFEIIGLDSLDAAAHAISSMQVRGAPLIGVTAAYGIYLAMCEDPRQLDTAITRLQATRPTAVNLRWALARCEEELSPLAPGQRRDRALELAQVMEKEDIAICEAIGEHGAKLLQSHWQEHCQPGERLNILTHCNAGALATVDWGTALACVYKAAAAGVPLHVWVDETRPRNQGAALTCWELGQQDIPHTLIVDNAGGHLMQRGRVDLCIVGSDRTTLAGDVCNKIGTYLKALAARDNDIPFYVALPVSSIDFDLHSGRDIPIEERAVEEVTEVMAEDDSGQRRALKLAPEGVAVSNPGFDVTPAALVSGLITERGVVAANTEALARLRDSLQQT
jgi:methylthioribose-1-phosphate isomerase